MIIFIIIIIILNSDAVSSLPVIFTLSKWLIRINIDETKKDKLNIDQTQKDKLKYKNYDSLGEESNMEGFEVFPFSQNCMLIMT